MMSSINTTLEAKGCCPNCEQEEEKSNTCRRRDNQWGINNPGRHGGNDDWRAMSTAAAATEGHRHLCYLNELP